MPPTLQFLLEHRPVVSSTPSWFYIILGRLYDDKYDLVWVDKGSTPYLIHSDNEDSWEDIEVVN